MREPVEHPSLWWQQEESEGQPRSLLEPHGNIFVGPNPVDYPMCKEDAWQYHAIVNVSCDPCATFYPSRPSQKMYWIPIHEFGVWNYSAFMQAVMIIDFHYKQGHRILVHCLGGLQRSPMMVMVWLYITQTKPYRLGKHDLRRGMTWEEAHALCYGWATEEEYNRDDKDSTKRSLEYFRCTCPKNFNLFIARLKANYEEKNCYAVCMDGYVGRLSNDRECRAPIQGYRLSARLKQPWYTLKSKVRSLQEGWRRLVRGQAQVRVASCHYTTIDGDDLLRTTIRWIRRRLINDNSK